MTDTTSIISCRGLTKQYHDSGLDVDVLRGVDFSIAKGERVAIIGPSGSGKSTLMHLLGAIDRPSSGEVRLFEHDLHQLSEKKRCQYRNQYLGFIYQFHHLLPEFTAVENVAMPLLIGGHAIKKSLGQAKALLESIGLGERLQHRLGQLSGGERQRVAIARAMVTKPACILADEPTGNLDHHTAERVFQVMLELNKVNQTSMLVVTHDLKLAKNMDKIYLLEDGQLQLQD